MTNGDRIRKMTNEEIAKNKVSNQFCNLCALKDNCNKHYDTCYNKWIKWLDQEEN